MTALIILIALIVIIADELNTRKKRRNNQAAAQKRVNEFNAYMQKLKDIQEKDHSKDLWGNGEKSHDIISFFLLLVGRVPADI